MLTVDSLSYSYNNRLIFKDLGFTLWPGTCLLVHGRNGVGKTTLLKILAGMVKPDTGDVLFASEETKINYVGHNIAVKENLSVIENLEFYAKLTRSEELILPALYYFKLHDVADEYCKNLSAGYKKRTALARLLACFSNIWILDEPEANLDTEGKMILKNLIDSRTSQNGIVIIASHNFIDYRNSISINIEDFQCDN